MKMSNLQNGKIICRKCNSVFDMVEFLEMRYNEDIITADIPEEENKVECDFATESLKEVETNLRKIRKMYVNN